MEIKFLEIIITPFLRLIAKFKIKEHVINVFDTLAKARSILVLMPEKLDDFGVARNYLTVIHDNFPEAKIIVVMRDLYENLLNNSGYYGTIFVTSKNINMFGLPKKELLQKLVISNYDIAIDLNRNFHLLSTYLCQKSGALLRICLENSKREPFYNFSFRSPIGEKLENKYCNLFKYLNVTVKSPVANFDDKFSPST